MFIKRTVKHVKIGFDNDKYLKLQSENILKRVNKFGDKLYIEFGGKLFDDYHASRVLPGFLPDSKLRMLLTLKDKVEVVIAINAKDILKNKMRGDLNINYETEVLRLIDAFRSSGLFVGSVCITQYQVAPQVASFKKKLNNLGVKTYLHYEIAGYPHDINNIISENESKILFAKKMKFKEDLHFTSLDNKKNKYINKNILSKKNIFG